MAEGGGCANWPMGNETCILLGSLSEVGISGSWAYDSQNSQTELGQAIKYFQ